MGRCGPLPSRDFCRFGMTLSLLCALLAGLLQTDLPDARLLRASQLGVDQAASGTLQGWESGAPLWAGANGPTETADDWFCLEFPRPISPAPPTTELWQMLLADGGVVQGTPTTLADGTPAFQLHGLGLGTGAMPLDTLWLSRLGRKRLPQAEEEQDVLWAVTPNGERDVQRGYFLEWTKEGVVFEGPGGNRLFAWENLSGVGLLPEPLPAPEQAVWIELRQGSTFSAEVLAMDEEFLRLRLPWGANWQLPLREVSRLRRRAGLQSLHSALWAVLEKPESAAMNWQPKVNRAVEGGFLQVGKQRFAEGLGVRAPTTLQVGLSNPGVLFVTVGVDDQVANFYRPQPLRFEILLGEEVLAEVSRQAVGEAPRSMVVSVPRAGELSLRVHGLKGLSFGGHGNWLDLQYLAKTAE